MQFYPSFYFNYPLPKKKTEWFPNQSKEIINKAKGILKNRKNKEINYALSTINWLREGENARIIEKTVKSNPQEEMTLISDFGNYERSNQSSPAQTLFEQLKEYDISGQKDLPKAKYSEYFAVLALALICELFNEFNFEESKSFKDKKDKVISNLKISACIIMDAMEAISFAEFYSWNIEDKIKKDRSLRGQSAAIKSHGKTNQIKLRFINFYRSKKFLKKIHAVREFIKTLNENERKLFSPDNIERFFSNAIRDYEKGKLIN